MQFKDMLSLAALALGVFLSATNVYLFFNGSAEREVKRLKAQLEMLDLKPRFDVTYYGVQNQNALAYALFETGDKTGIEHPLAKAKQITTATGDQLFLPKTADMKVDAVLHERTAKTGEPDFELTRCAFEIFYVQYNGAPKLPKVTINFDVVEADDGIAPSVDNLQFNEGGYDKAVEGFKRSKRTVDLANVAGGDAFYLPMTLGCHASSESDGRWLDFSYERIGVPVDLEYLNPIDGETVRTPIRGLLENAIVNEAGIAERG